MEAAPALGAPPDSGLAAGRPLQIESALVRPFMTIRQRIQVTKSRPVSRSRIWVLE